VLGWIEDERQGLEDTGLGKMQSLVYYLHGLEGNCFSAI
jgi:hypothetical protein